MLEKIIQSKSKRFFLYTLSFLIGISVISIIDLRVDFLILYLFYFFIITFLVLFWQNKKIMFCLLCLLFLLLGISRYLISFPPDSFKQISHYNGEKKEIIGFIAAEPDVRMDGVRYILKVQEFEKGGRVRGKVYFKYNLYPRFNYGDKLKIKCSLRTPEPIETDEGRDFRYDMYLARYRVFSLCREPVIEKIGEEEGNMILRGIFSLKRVVAERINKLWHEPHASFMAGLLYGYRGGLGSLNELFSRTGVTHIVAISGYNITIIATIFITICLNLYIPRKKAFWVISVGIILFVLFAGASASVVRAGIMGIIVLLAKQVGRMSGVGNVMILTCVLMCFQNPFVLIWDAGFQLSFISTLGLVYLTPSIEKYFIRVPEFLSLRESLVSTLSAITATLPLILFQFGRLSVVAPIVNILILWILPILMALGFFAVMATFVFNPLAQILAWLSWLGLSYIIVVVKWFAELEFAAVDLQVPWWGMVVMYIFLGVIIFQTNKKL
ncbi:MAG: DUF4131 domain-containing protein [Candidatus Magasanikbacteria bacterium]|nr:DUF4131 domain-containing protein [Candidatus Magasanikbacteria bacterium]